MARKTLLLGTFILALLLTVSIFSYQPRTQDLPPGVASADWIKLSDDSGVQLTKSPYDRQFLGLKPNDLHGTLYVKVDNIWHRLYFDSPYARPKLLGQQ
jgi:hypothetical protein